MTAGYAAAGKVSLDSWTRLLGTLMDRWRGAMFGRDAVPCIKKRAVISTARLKCSSKCGRVRRPARSRPFRVRRSRGSTSRRALRSMAFRRGSLRAARLLPRRTCTRRLGSGMSSCSSSGSGWCGRHAVALHQALTSARMNIGTRDVAIVMG